MIEYLGLRWDYIQVMCRMMRNNTDVCMCVVEKSGREIGRISSARVKRQISIVTSARTTADNLRLLFHRRHLLGKDVLVGFLYEHQTYGCLLFCMLLKYAISLLGYVPLYHHLSLLSFYGLYTLLFIYSTFKIS